MRGLAFVLAFVALATAAEKVRYDHHKLCRVQVADAKTAEYVLSMEEAGDVRLWNNVRVGATVDVMFSPDKSVERMLEGLKYDVINQNVQESFDAEEARIGSRQKQGPGYDWQEYSPLSEINAYIEQVEVTYDYVNLVSIGQSFEGEDMRVVEICKGGCGSKDALFIEGGIHAREWISPATVTYFIDQLTAKLSDDSLLDNFDWYILPVVNPDGYKYTWDVDRLWRKTRSDNGGSCPFPPDSHPGADPNRNWGFQWNTGGTSDNVCSDTYHGPTAFSEIEVDNVAKYIESKADQIIYFNDVHSYSQLILLPYGTDVVDPDPVEQEERLTAANIGNEALFATHGMEYEVGRITDVIYVASGGSLDWTLGSQGIMYSFAMELRDKGQYGFLLPPEQIIPTGEEAWAFHVAIADYFSKLPPEQRRRRK